MCNLLTSSTVVKVAGLYSVFFLNTRTRNFPSSRESQVASRESL